MNKVILTHDRLFMSIVGPSGSGKTELMFHMLQGNSFYPRLEKIYYFYKEFQPLFREMRSSIARIEFIKHSGLEITKNLSNCLLIFDDSCEEIFNDKEFVKIATSGRHRKLHVIYVKHNLFHQSKWSRTIDLNTTHIILFKSLRDIQQIEYLGKQLNCLQLLKDAYKLATAEPYGHLIIDLDPKTSQGLRFASQIIGPDPSIFTFLHKKQSLHQLRMKKRHLLILKQWKNSTNKNSNIDFRLFSDSDFIWFLSDCVMNVLSGVVPVNKKELKKFEKTLQLSNRKVGKTERLKLIKSPSGISLIQLIAIPCIEYLEQNAY